MLLSEYPGYTRGLERYRRAEELLRGFAMTPLPERINGIEVRQLTPRHLNLIFLARSPFLISPRRRRHFGVAVHAEDVALFLWIVSLANPLDGSRAPENFFANLRPDEPEYFRCFYRAIDRYYDRAMLDRPAGAAGGRVVAAAISASIVHRIASAYGWPDEVLDRKGRPVALKGILDMPIARLYQYWRWIAVDKNPKTALFSRLQDRFTRSCILKWRGRAEAAGFLDDPSLSGREKEGVYRYLVATGRLTPPPSFSSSSSSLNSQPSTSPTDESAVADLNPSPA